MIFLDSGWYLCLFFFPTNGEVAYFYRPTCLFLSRYLATLEVVRAHMYREVERMEMLLMISGMKRASFHVINTSGFYPSWGKLWTVQQTPQRPDFRAQLAADTLEMFGRWHSRDASCKYLQIFVFTDNSFTKCSWAHIDPSYNHVFHKVSFLANNQAFRGGSLSPVTNEPVYVWNVQNVFLDHSWSFCCPFPNLSEACHKIWNIFTKISEWKSTFGIRSA